MYVLITQFDLRPGALAEFVAALEEMDRSSRAAGRGLKALEVVRDGLIADRLVVYEVHATHEDLHQHRLAAPYLAFDARTADLLKQLPLVICEGLRLYPEDAA